MSGRLMRVLMTTDTVGGVWTYALDLARALVPHGVSTLLAVIGPRPSRPDLRLSATVPNLELVELGGALDWLARDEAEIGQSAAAVAELARAEDVEVVHLNSPALAGCARFGVPVIGVCHSCVASWSLRVRGEMPQGEAAWRTAALARGYAACERLVAPSASFASLTERIYRLRPSVIHNGRAAVRPTQDPRGRFALTAGRLWDEGKNIAALDAAAAEVDFPVIAAGSLGGPAGGHLALRSIRPLGRLDAAKLRRWMSRAPAFVSVARYEPFGLAVLEAAQAGCGLVLSDIDTFRELWDGAALFVDPAAPAQIAAALQRLIDEPETASALGAAARARADRYSLAATAQQMHALYRSVRAPVDQPVPA